MTPSAFPLLTAEIRTGPQSPLFELAAVTLTLGWPGSRVAIEEVFSGMSAGEAIVFFDALRGDQQNPGAVNKAFQGKVVELSGHLALHHRDAQIRAVALVFLAGSPVLAA